MLTKEEGNKIKVADDTEVAYINGEKIYAENLQKWAYRRLLTWPALFEACQALSDTYLDSLNDNTGCTCQRCSDASVKARLAIMAAMESV